MPGRAIVWSFALIACGSTAPPKVSAPPPRDDDRAAEQERARRQQLAAAHHDIEREQQEALAAKCEPEQVGEKRCLPSCYETEAPDPRAGKKLAGAVEIQHLACEDGRDSGPFLVDELGKQLAVRPVRGRFPRAHRSGWEADFARALAKQHRPALAKGDVLVVTGPRRPLEHPLTKARLTCAPVSHFTRGKGALDACGAAAGIACEAEGNPTARAINVVHYRLAEARQLHASGRDEDCQQAALEAIAVARGLPRWRQYMDLNVNQWPSHAGYRTRFDGVLDEAALFATVARYGTEAEALHATCGGSRPKTTAAQEQSFHACW